MSKKEQPLQVRGYLEGLTFPDFVYHSLNGIECGDLKLSCPLSLLDYATQYAALEAAREQDDGSFVVTGSEIIEHVRELERKYQLILFPPYPPDDEENDE